MKIRPLSVVVVVFVALAAALAQTSVSVAYNYAPISYPGSRVTYLNGINNSNVIVGSYFDSKDFVHGFVYRAGKYTAVNFPGSTMTEVFGVNDGGDIVGMYQLPGTLNFHGFLRHGNTYAPIDDPSATIGTIAYGINNSETIVGSYDNVHGFVYQNGKFRTLDAPQLAGESHETQLNGINSLGWIVGQVFTSGIWRGFWFDNGKFHFVEPAGSRDSELTGINGRGDVVGCHDSQAGFAAFAAGNYGSAGRYPLEQPMVSCASAINYARAIVGSYSSSNDSNGFLAVPALTLQVSTPSVKALSTGVVPLTASAFGNNKVSRIEVWVGGKKIYSVSGATLNASVRVPAGTGERLVIQAVDSKGVVAKIVQTVTVK